MKRKGVATLPDGTEMRYRDYIASDRWREKKEAYRASKLIQACWCGETRVDLHHRTYKNLGHERLWDLIPLCREHHDLLHDGLKKRGGKGLWSAARIQRKRA